MSATAIGKIIQQSGATPKTSSESKALKQKTDEIVKELVNETQQSTQQQKRGPGRPKGTSPGRPKTPPPGLQELNGVSTTLPPLPNFNPAEKIRNEILIRKLNIYVRKFPEYSGFFQAYNPLMHHPDENEKIISAFLDLIHTEIEFATAPAAVSGIITGAEEAAVIWALDNPGHPATKVIEDLYGVSSSVLQDKAVSLDVRLLECEIAGFLPKNPRLRLLLNVARSVFQYWQKNKVDRKISAVDPKEKSAPPPPTPDKFKSF